MNAIRTFTNAEMQQAVAAVKKFGSQRKAAMATGISQTQINWRVKQFEKLVENSLISASLFDAPKEQEVTQDIVECFEKEIYIRPTAHRVCVSPDIYVEVRTFTPAECSTILQNPENLDSNRSIRQNQIENFSSHMKNDSWRLNGQTVVFGANHKKLLTGFHRMESCVIANTPFTTLVVYGVEHYTQSSMDVCSPQTPRDGIQMSGERDIHGELTLALTGLTHYRLRRFNFVQKGPSTNIESGNRMQVEDYHNLLSKHMNLKDSIRFVKSIAPSKTKLNIPAVSIVHYLASEIGGMKENANKWATLFMNGASLTDKSPILKAREFHQNGHLLVYSKKLYTLVKSYNMWVRKDTKVLCVAREAIELVGAPPESIAF